jgi:hypothetical protein
MSISLVVEISKRMQGQSAMAREVWTRLVWLAIYAAAMGLLEAICVIYLRRYLPFDTGVPVPRLERLHIEVIREASTLVMLVAVAWLVGTNARSRIANFFFVFGIWDIVYYASFWWLVGWPTSLLEWDCLFLIPKPWYAPVLAPMLISTYFVLACCWINTCEAMGKPMRFSIALIVSQLLAFIVWYWSFIKDTDRIAAHGYIGVTYSWMLCGIGGIIGTAGLYLPARLFPVPSNPNARENA